MEKTLQEVLADKIEGLAPVASDGTRISREAVLAAIREYVAPLEGKVRDRDVMLAGSAATITTMGLEVNKLQAEIKAKAIAINEVREKLEHIGTLADMAGQDLGEVAE